MIYDDNRKENTDKIYLPSKMLGLQYSIVNSRLLDRQDFTRLVQLPRHLDGAPSYMASWVTVTVGMPTETPTVLAVCVCEVPFLGGVYFNHGKAEL